MTILRYTAKNAAGVTQKGTIDALDPKKAAEAMIANGLTPITISEQGQSVSLIDRLRGHVSGKQIVGFTRQLATMVSAGLPLSQALETLESQCENETLRKALSDILRDVEGGSPFSVSLAKHDLIFSKVYINLVKVGEASGKLDSVLLNLAEAVERSYEFKAKVRGAMIYPVMIMVVMLAVFAFMFIFVVPQLAEIYKSFDAELPIQTKFVITISELVTKKGWLFVLISLTAQVSFFQFKKTQTGRHGLARLALAFPILGKLHKNIEITEFTRTLGLLVQSGVPILQSLEISTDSMSNSIYIEGVRNATKQVERGVSISVALSNTTEFPPMLTQMISVGEHTGKLDEVLKKLSEFLQRETDSSVANLTTALEPMILLILGAMVGFLVMSIVMPIYNLTSGF